jgi:hypothetical protein
VKVRRARRRAARDQGRSSGGTERVRSASCQRRGSALLASSRTVDTAKPRSYITPCVPKRGTSHLRTIMRPQARPFAVEIKNRKRTTQPAMTASFVRQNEWLHLIPPDDLPERDVHEDLAIAPAHSDAFRDAERVFTRTGDSGHPVVETHNRPPAPVVIAEPEAPAPRVLPDLLAAAREQERVSVQLPRTKRAATSTPTRRRRTKADDPTIIASVPSGMDETESLIAVRSGHAEAAIAMSRRRHAGSKLPPGQRWKERRLPKVCWAAKRQRRRRHDPRF